MPRRTTPYAADGVLNSYTFGGPSIYARDGTCLGRLNSNRYDPESGSNPYGRYGSRLQPKQHQQSMRHLREPILDAEPEQPSPVGVG